MAVGGEAGQSQRHFMIFARTNVVISFITDGTGQSKLIYKTSIKGGFSGCWQQIVWFIKRMFHAY